MTPPPADQDVEEGAIDIAHVAPFRLGRLEIRPSVRQVGVDGRELTVEPRVLQVLIALAEADGAVVSRDVLVRRCWEGRIIGEDAINRSIAKARQLADLTRPPAFAIETIPRVGYRLRPKAGATAAGAVPGFWAPGRRTIIASMVCGVAGMATGAYFLLRPRPKSDPLVAVLPFDNLSPDPQMGYFADGLSEDILNALIRGGGVRVSSGVSSFTFRGPAKAKAAAMLKADYLLDGSVLRDGQRLRVTAHLTDVARQQVLWSDSYDRDVGQGLQIEDDVAGRVAEALRAQVAPRPQAARLVDPAAYDLYLRGKAAIAEHTPESMRQGNLLLRSAVEKAPDFAPAWLELARNYWRSGFLQPVPEHERGFELGRQAARRAIALDPHYGAAYGVISQMTPRFGHWEEIDRQLSYGLSLSPNDPYLVAWRAEFLIQVGRLKAAVETSLRAQTLDPLELFANHSLCQILIYAQRFPEAQAMAERIRTVWPDQIASYWDRFWLMLSWRRLPDALAVLDEPGHPTDPAGEFEVWRRSLRATQSGSAADRAAAAKAVLRLAEHGIGYASQGMVVLAAMGQTDAVLELGRSLYLNAPPVRIDRSVQFLGNSRYPPNGLPDAFYLFHPFLAPLRRAGKLDDVFEGIGLAAYWRKAGPPDA
jgi:TolB-like protein/DNA-binding winged helix-turn-helix (wHTH) protein